MKDQLQAIRVALFKWGWATEQEFSAAITALNALEADHYSAADMASAAAQGFRDGVASVTAGQEPVAWAVYDIKYGGSRSLHWPKDHSPNGDSEHYKAVPLYAAPVAQQPQAEAVRAKLGKEKVMNDPYASEADTKALLQRDTRTPAEKKLDQMLDERWANEQGVDAVGVLRQIAIELIAQQPQAEPDPCPDCVRGRVCKTPSCGRLKLPVDHPLRGGKPAPQQAEAVPPGYALVPIDVLEAASESLGSFVSDHGWTSLDMQAMDNLDSILAQQKGVNHG